MKFDDPNIFSLEYRDLDKKIDRLFFYADNGRCYVLVPQKPESMGEDTNRVKIYNIDRYE